MATVPTAPTQVPATAMQIVNRALDIGDLVGNQHITFSDWYRSLNETHKTVYAKMIEMDDDYSIVEYLVTLNPSMQTTTTGPWEYFIPNPSDFMKLRFVEWNAGNQWMPMDKFNLDNKNQQSAFPMYHERNNGILVIAGMLSSTVAAIRIGYVPQPSIVTVPNTAIQYGLSWTAAQFNNISYPTYVNYTGTTANDAMIYAYNPGSTNYIYVEINQNTVTGGSGTPVQIYSTYESITGISYYKGYLYFCDSSGVLYKAALDLTNPTAITPASILSAGSNVQNFSILNNTIIFSGTSSTSTCTLNGGSITPVYSFPTLGQALAPNTPNITWVIDTSHNLCILTGGLTSIVLPGMLDITTDGTNLYVLDTSNNLWSYTTVPTVNGYGVLGTGTYLASDITNSIGQYSNNRIGVVTKEGAQLLAFSTYPNYIFPFQSNIVYDIYCYQLAKDFCRKQKDTERMGVIDERLKELWNTYSMTLRRDIYRPPRIRNVYANYPYGIG